MATTPTTPGMGQQEALYRGAALSCLRRLKDANKGLTIYHGTYQLPGGVEVFCNVCGNKEDVYVRVPRVAQEGIVPASILTPQLIFSLAAYDFSLLVGPKVVVARLSTQTPRMPLTSSLGPVVTYHYGGSSFMFGGIEYAVPHTLCGAHVNRNCAIACCHYNDTMFVLKAIRLDTGIGEWKDAIAPIGLDGSIVGNMAVASTDNNRFRFFVRGTKRDVSFEYDVSLDYFQNTSSEVVHSGWPLMTHNQPISRPPANLVGDTPTSEMIDVIGYRSVGWWLEGVAGASDYRDLYTRSGSMKKIGDTPGTPGMQIEPSPLGMPTRYWNYSIATEPHESWIVTGVENVEVYMAGPTKTWRLISESQSQTLAATKSAVKGDVYISGPMVEIYDEDGKLIATHGPPDIEVGDMYERLGDDWQHDREDALADWDNVSLGPHSWTWTAPSYPSARSSSLMCYNVSGTEVISMSEDGVSPIHSKAITEVVNKGRITHTRFTSSHDDDNISTNAYSISIAYTSGTTTTLLWEGSTGFWSNNNQTYFVQIKRMDSLVAGVEATTTGSRVGVFSSDLNDLEVYPDIEVSTTAPIRREYVLFVDQTTECVIYSKTLNEVMTGRFHSDHFTSMPSIPSPAEFFFPPVANSLVRVFGVDVYGCVIFIQDVTEWFYIPDVRTPTVTALIPAVINSMVNNKIIKDVTYEELLGATYEGLPDGIAIETIGYTQ